MVPGKTISIEKPLMPPKAPRCALGHPSHGFTLQYSFSGHLLAPELEKPPEPRATPESGLVWLIQE